MATELETLVAKFEADSRGVRAELQKFGKQLGGIEQRAKQAENSISGGFKRIAVAAAAFVSIREVGQFFTGAVSAASDLNEALNKASVTFGGAIDTVTAFAESSANAFGIAKSEALEASANFGLLLKNAGLVEGASARMSTELVALAGDLASFNNLATSDALLKLQAGLVGEVEPLRRVGVTLSAAKVEAKAYELGIAALGDELTEAQKIQARFAVIMEETKTQQGDAARTSDEYATAVRRLQAGFKDMQAEIGGRLIPSMEQLLEVMLDPGFQDFAATVLGGIVEGVAKLAEGLGNLVIVAGDAKAALASMIPQSLTNLLGVASGAAGGIFDMLGLGGDADLSGIDDATNGLGRLEFALAKAKNRGIELSQAHRQLIINGVDLDQVFAMSAQQAANYSAEQKRLADTEAEVRRNDPSPEIKQQGDEAAESAPKVGKLADEMKRLKDESQRPSGGDGGGGGGAAGGAGGGGGPAGADPFGRLPGDPFFGALQGPAGSGISVFGDAARPTELLATAQSFRAQILAAAEEGNTALVQSLTTAANAFVDEFRDGIRFNLGLQGFPGAIISGGAGLDTRGLEALNIIQGTIAELSTIMNQASLEQNRKLDRIADNTAEVVASSDRLSASMRSGAWAGSIARSIESSIRSATGNRSYTFGAS